MPQTSYSQRMSASFAGQLGESGRGRSIRTFVNADVVGFPFGVGIVRKPGGAFDDGILPTAVTDPVAGILVHSHDLGVDGATAGSSLAGSLGMNVKERCNVLEFGECVVLTEQSMSPGDSVYMRVAAGAGTVIGAFRKDPDNGTARFMKSGRVVRNVSSTLALMWIDVAEELAQDSMEDVGPIAVASVAATTTTKLWKNRTDRHFQVDKVQYNNPTGLAASDTNFYVVQVKNITKAGTPSPASYSTKLTGGQGALTADTWTDFVLDATLANTVVNPGDSLSLVETLTGAATLAAGILVIHGHYI